MGEFKEDDSKLCKQEHLQYLKQPKIGAFGFSSKGESHKKKNLPGQDANIIKIVNSEHNTFIASIADGVGTAALSHYGSSIATKTATDYLAQIFHVSDISKMNDKQIGDYIREAMRRAREAVRKEAESQEQLEYSYQSTLTIAIYDGDNLYFGHIGDDGIVALTKEGKLEMVTIRHKGEECSSVYPLQAGENKWQVAKVVGVDGFVMATDGVLDAFVRNEFEGNRVYYPFIEPALKGNSGSARKIQEAFRDAGQEWLDYMNSSDFREQVTDDITFITCVNPERILQNPYKFDKDKWDKETQAYQQKRNRALYGNSSTPQIPLDKIGSVTSNVTQPDRSRMQQILGIVRDAAKDIGEVMRGDRND